MAKIAKHFDMQNPSNNKDRISALPDHLLHHIMSFFPSINVVQSCVLSKRWIDLWCSIPFVDYELRHTEHDKCTCVYPKEAIKFLDCLLHRRDGSDVHSLRLHLSWKNKCVMLTTDTVNSWISFAVRHNIRVLDFGLNYLPNIPPSLFTSTSLRVLKLSVVFAHIRMPKSVRLPMLEMLSLTGVFFEHDELSKLISSCPSLSALMVHSEASRSSGLLTISNPQLETLVLELSFTSTKIHAPRLTSLKFKLHFMTYIDLDDCPSLVDANIEMTSRSSEPVKPVLKALKSVESLELSQGFIWACARIFIFEVGQHILECPFNNLKFLKLTTFFKSREVQMINILLRFSPNIETFILKNGAPEEEENVPTVNLGFDEHELSHLRLVKFQDFQGLQNEVKLVEFFLKKATSLVKLNITTPDCLEDSESKDLLADISKILLKCPRVSTICINADRKELLSAFV